MGNAALGAYLRGGSQLLGQSIIAEPGNIVDMLCETEEGGEIWIGRTGKLMIQGEYYV